MKLNKWDHLFALRIPAECRRLAYTTRPRKLCTQTPGSARACTYFPIPTHGEVTAHIRAHARVHLSTQRPHTDIWNGQDTHFPDLGVSASAAVWKAKHPTSTWAAPAEAEPPVFCAGCRNPGRATALIAPFTDRPGSSRELLTLNSQKPSFT